MTDLSEPLWVATARAPSDSAPRDSGDAPSGGAADIVVIGSGITGLTAATLLSEGGHSVIVLDSGEVAEGESGNTTAHLTAAMDARYRKLERTFGRDASRLVARAGTEAIAFIEQRSLGIPCRFRRVPGYLFTERRNRIADLKGEMLSAREAGLDVSWVDEIPLPFPTRGAIRFEEQAQFHPREYLLGLAGALKEPVRTATKVSSIKEEGETCVVETSQGTFTAKKVIMATNTPIEGVTILTKIASYRSYAMALPVEAPHPDGLFWDTADPYHYIRWQETSAGTYLIVGGEDHKVGEDGPETAFEALQQYLDERFAGLTAQYRWSGQIIEPVDGLPYIGPADAGARIYLATGYSGQGMTFGTIAGLILADQIDGKQNPYSDLFSPSRIHARGAVTNFITENLSFPRHIIRDRLLSQDAESNAAVDPGAGKILVVEGKKLAVARDGQGVLHAVSPVCTHMRCDVAWNGAEASWDCPCHGSRFSIEGTVLNGPATQPLEKIALEGDEVR